MHVFTMCPICGAEMHLNVTDAEKWREERHLGTGLAEVVPEFCVFCFDELTVGQDVITRSIVVTDSTSFEGGKRGRIASIRENREGGKLYYVRLEDDSEAALPRIALTSAVWAEIVEQRMS